MTVRLAILASVLAFGGAACTEDAVLYETDGTVLEQRIDWAQPAHGPEMCAGMILASLPPQCGGLPIEGWDWDAVDGEEAAGSSTWGDFHVVGTYEDGVFVVSEVSPSVERRHPDVQTRAACSSPAGRWDRGAARDYTEALQHHLQSQIDSVAIWLSPVVNFRSGGQEPRSYVLNAVFEEKRARHEELIRRYWDGQLCVVARKGPSYEESEWIATEAERELERRGVDVDGWFASEGGVEVSVALDEGGAAQAYFDAKYGPRVVVVSPLLQPVEE